MRTAVVFFVWQSDQSASRNTIKSALKKAVNALKSDELDVLIDQEVESAAGAVQIDEVILSQIRQADVVVCDVTPIAWTRRPSDVEVEIDQVGDDQEANPKAIPNPNVMLECGYAMATVGLERMILVRDERVPGDLPFDIRQKRTMGFAEPAKIRFRCLSSC